MSFSSASSSPSRPPPPPSSSAGVSKAPPGRPPPPSSSNNSSIDVNSSTNDMASISDASFGSGFSGCGSSAASGGDAGVHKSAWDDIFGATSSAPTSSGFDDKFDAFEPNGHIIGADDEFLGLRGNTSSSTLTAAVDGGSSPWSAHTVGGGDDLFGTGLFASSPFGGAETTQGSGGGGGGGGGPGSRARPRPSAAAANSTTNAANPFSIALQAVTANRSEYDADDDEEDAVFGASSTTNNPFADNADDGGSGHDIDVGFNPFATIADEESVIGGGPGNDDDQRTVVFDPFQTILDDDALNVPFSSTDRDTEDDVTSPSRFNPFDKEPPLHDRFAALLEQPKPKSEDLMSPKTKSIASSFEDEPEDDSLEPLEPFLPRWETTGGWNLLLRQPFRKHLTQNRFWKPAFVRVARAGNSEDGGTPVIRVYSDDKSSECLHELMLDPSYSLCEMGLQQLDQFGKCHTVKLQQVSYKESVGVKTDRIAPTIGDLARVRDLKGLKDLIHKPKATMLLDHAPHANEILKFGGLDYAEFKNFVYTMDDLFFCLRSSRGSKCPVYTKDEITMDVQDEYYADIDRDGHITRHKARVRLFCLTFLTGGSPMLEVGINDKRRRGREVVGRRDIIPIKTEEWIRTEDSELHSSIDVDEFERSKVLRFAPLDACRYELMRFRVRPRLNIELPLQVRVQMSVVNRHIEIRAEVVVTGYYTSSRRAAQTPCEDIQIRFPLPEQWIYMFRIERRFKYGAVHSATRKPGKIKGFERLTQLAQGILPPSLIEVSAGLAKYEHAFKAIVWRIDQLPERNEGAYKTHLFALNVDLGPQDTVPDSLDKFVNVEYSMANSTVSRAQVRSISVSGTAAEDPPDRWVRHMARYEYTVEIEFTDRVRCKPSDQDDGDGYDVEGQRSAAVTTTEGSTTGSPGPVSHDSDSSATDDSD